MFGKISICLGTTFLLGVAFCSGCNSSDTTQEVEAPKAKPQSMPQENDNQEILVEANQANAWFHAKKVKPLWAKEVIEEQKITTIEGEETAHPGDFLCKGEAGDIWPQSAKSLNKKYDATDEVNDDGWRKYIPKQDAEGVMAIQIEHEFEVKASWGELQGKSGDYLLKNFADKETEFPKDVWIVDQAIFDSTYKRVDE